MDLGDIRVLDLTQLLPGPYTTQLLADLGMDVVKVEATGDGDRLRALAPSLDEHSAAFASVNRGKRSVALDLKRAGGRAALHDLVETADVVVESFRPGVVERLGADYETITARNNTIVYCSLSGFGQDGPLANQPGHDLTYAGLSGFLHLNRRAEDQLPSHPGFLVADVAGGLFAAFAILGALLDVAFGGHGSYVDVSMADVLLSFARVHDGKAFAKTPAQPGETRHNGKYPCYDSYRTADDRYVTLAALEPKFWKQFCAELGRRDLIPFHLADDPAVRAELRAELRSIFSDQSRDEWESQYSDSPVPLIGVYSLEEALAHPHFEARDMVQRYEDWPPRLGFPARMTDGVDIPGSIPDHGQHTTELLRDVGYEPSTLEALRRKGVIE